MLSSSNITLLVLGIVVVGAVFYTIIYHVLKKLGITGKELHQQRKSDMNTKQPQSLTERRQQTVSSRVSWDIAGKWIVHKDNKFTTSQQRILQNQKKKATSMVMDLLFKLILNTMTPPVNKQTFELQRKKIDDLLKRETEATYEFFLQNGNSSTTYKINVFYQLASKDDMSQNEQQLKQIFQHLQKFRKKHVSKFSSFLRRTSSSPASQQKILNMSLLFHPFICVEKIISITSNDDDDDDEKQEARLVFTENAQDLSKKNLFHQLLPQPNLDVTWIIKKYSVVQLLLLGEKMIKDMRHKVTIILQKIRQLLDDKCKDKWNSFETQYQIRNMDESDQKKMLSSNFLDQIITEELIVL